MIVVNQKYFKLVIGASKVDLSDYFRIADYTDYKGNQSKIPFGFKQIVRHTASIDLTIDKETLFSNMKSNTRNEVRRAEKEGITISDSCSIQEFVSYYNKFADDKGLSHIGTNNLTKYPEIFIYSANYGDDVLSMHASFVDKSEKTIYLLYSCSTRHNENIDRKMVGWSNRYLHYKEFEKFKDQGYIKYEWSGICIDPEDKARYSIGQFKLGFGDGDVRESIELRSPLFSFANFLKKLISC